MVTILNSRWLLSLIFFGLALGNTTTSYYHQTSANMSMSQSMTIQTFNKTFVDPLITHNSTIVIETEKLIDEIIAIEQVDPLVNNSKEDPPNFLTFEEWKKRKLNLTDDEADEKVDGHSNINGNENNNPNLSNNNTREIKNEILKNDKLKNEENSRYVSRGRKIDMEDSNNLNGPVGEEMEFEISLFSGPGEEQGKLYKDRFNFASFDCAATIVKTNHEAKSANAILNENKDSYLLNACEAANKYVIIELCEDILVDEVLIGNFEFYSSMFKEIKISVSDRFPTSQWIVLGLFTAENLRKLQLFRIENPLIWAKFIKIETLSHYGDEYYCPLSSVQVHGTTMIEQFKEENPDISGQEPIIKKNEENLNNFEDNLAASVLIKNDPKTIIYDEKKPKFNVCIDQQSISSTINFESLGENDDCIVRPYLGLEQFLKDYNSQKESECKVNDDLVSPTSLKFSPSPSSSSSSKSTILTAASVPQDSIYKNIIKRLNLLESNATLSLLYIEEQSKILSNAFSDLESKQTLKFQNILVQLNKTINSQINTFNLLNKELSLNFEKLFNYQSIQFESILSKSNYQFNSLYQDLSFYKKINYLNLFLILLLIIYIILTRDTYIEQEYSSQNQSGLISPLSHRNHFEKSDQTPSSSPSPLPSPLTSPSLSPISQTVGINKPKIFKKRSKFFDKFLSGRDNKLYNNVNDNHEYEYEYEYDVENEIEIEAENIGYGKLNDDILITDANLNLENSNNDSNNSSNNNNNNINKRKKRKAKKRK